MTVGSAERAPVLVLGLGNTLLWDDGTGIRLLAMLEQEREWGAGVEFLDGGTQGLALLGAVESRAGLLVLDAVGSGVGGAVKRVDGDDLAALRAQRSTTAHEGNALELLEAAVLLGVAPKRTIVVGVSPVRLTTGIGLSDAVEAALPEAVAQAVSALMELTAPPSLP
ncbi:MAG: hydrogenase maturation protease [Acidobacteria bacterium]|nr:hydrogenase maturation protease [Acidobacteriota bacterium]